MIHFQTQPVSLAAIDIDDRTHQISAPADTEQIEALAVSITRIGLLSPPLVGEGAAGMRIVSGFRRMAACHQLKRETVFCRVLAPETAPAVCAQLAVAENAWHRPLTLMEKARAFVLLDAVFFSSEHTAPEITDAGGAGPAKDRAAKLAEIAAPLGLVENPDMIGKLIRLTRLSPSILAAVETGTIGLVMALELGTLDPEEGGLILGLFQRFRYGLNRQRELMEMVREIAKRESISIRRLLASDEIAAILARTDLDLPAIGGALRRYLKQRRYPALTRAQIAFEKLEKDLPLRGRIRLNPPPYFEGSTYQLIFSFDTLAELKRHHHHFDQIRQHPSLARFLED